MISFDDALYSLQRYVDLYKNEVLKDAKTYLLVIICRYVALLHELSNEEGFDI